MQERTPEVLQNMVNQAFPHILARFKDPKNAEHGDWLGTPGMEMYLWLKEEAQECYRAHLNKEGVDREIEELSDSILIGIMRLDELLTKRGPGGS